MAYTYGLYWYCLVQVLPAGHTPWDAVAAAVQPALWQRPEFAAAITRSQTLAFTTGLLLGFLDDRSGGLVRLVENLGSLLLGFTERLSSFFLGHLQVALGTAGGIQTFGNFLLAGLHCSGDRRPNKRHGEPDENSEGNRLTEQRQVNVHSDLPRAIS